MDEAIQGTVFEEGAKSEGDWFTFFTSHLDAATGEIVYDPPVEGAAEFCFRSPVSFWEEQRKTRKKEYKMVVNPNTRAMERVGYYPDLPPEEEKEERDGSWDYVIIGMRNAKWSGSGPDMECTRDNKLKLLKNSAFLRFANRVLELITETGVKQKKAAEKNLSPSPSGEPVSDG
jgi:hypothetical protein